MLSFKIILQRFLQQFKQILSSSYLHLDVEFESNGSFCPPLIQLINDDKLIFHYLELDTHKTIESYNIESVDVAFLTSKILEMIKTYSLIPIEIRIFEEDGISFNECKINSLINIE